MKELDKDKLNWDNNFSTRFSLDNGKCLTYIPANIYSIEMPEINIKDIDNNMEKYIGIILRSTQDGRVEKEVYDVLARTTFDIEVSLSNPNKADYVYKQCSVERLEFKPLINRPNANPFNFTVWIKVNQIVYKGGDEDVVFGKPEIQTYDVDDEETENDK